MFITEDSQLEGSPETGGKKPLTSLRTSGLLERVYISGQDEGQSKCGFYRATAFGGRGGLI